MNTLKQRVRVGLALIAASLFVLTLTAYAGKAGRGPKAPPAEQISPKIRQALEQKVDLQFDKDPMIHVVMILNEVYEVNIVLFLQDMPPDGTSVTLGHEGKLAEILDDLCELSGPAWKVEGNSIVVAKRETLQATFKPQDFLLLACQAGQRIAWKGSLRRA